LKGERLGGQTHGQPGLQLKDKLAAPLVQSLAVVVSKLDGERKALAEHVIASPAPLSENGDVKCVAVVVSSNRLSERGALKRAGFPGFHAWLHLAFGAVWNVRMAAAVISFSEMQ
jgi:hypothetical protein